MRRHIRLVYSTLLMALALVGNVSAQTRIARPQDLKAAFLFNFTQFVEWPATAFANEKSPFVIGIVGEDPFGNTLDQLVANESVHNHKIIVRRYRDSDDLSTCHLLYVSPSGAGRWEHLAELIKDKSILTVGETDDFMIHGGMIRFVITQNRLRLVVDSRAAEATQLVISSKLLRLAKIVDPKQEQP
jgi:hypothetical protein